MYTHHKNSEVLLVVITLHGRDFKIHGYRVIEGEYTYVFATDEEHNIYKLTWSTGNEPNNHNTIIHVIHHSV
ncbi:hypothetical protein NV377_06245 [Paenibacillus sp. T3-5-0-4]|nr:hypothetical protein [Paenibacillus endoradicis]